VFEIAIYLVKRKKIQLEPLATHNFALNDYYENNLSQPVQEQIQSHEDDSDLLPISGLAADLFYKA